MAEILSLTDATTKILAARLGGSLESIRPTAWLACMTLTHVGRTLVHDPPAVDMDALLAALARMLRGLFGEEPTSIAR